MSSYLNFFLVPKRKNKTEPKQYLSFVSYSRNTDIYSVFNENISIAYAGNTASPTILTLESIHTVIDSLASEIRHCKERASYYERYSNGNSECIETLIGINEILHDTEQTLSCVTFIESIITDITNDCTAFEELCCNID